MRRRTRFSPCELPVTARPLSAPVKRDPPRLIDLLPVAAPSEPADERLMPLSAPAEPVLPLLIDLLPGPAPSEPTDERLMPPSAPAELVLPLLIDLLPGPAPSEPADERRMPPSVRALRCITFLPPEAGFSLLPDLPPPVRPL